MIVNRIPRAYSKGGAAEGYTELAPITITPTTAGAWTEYDLYTNHDIPKGAVVEIFAGNKDLVDEYYGGLRDSNSSIDRRLEICKVELSNSYTLTRFIVTCDASSGKIKYYAGDTSAIRFIIVGYWEGVTFTERFDEITVTSAEDNMWTAKNLNTLFSTPVNRVYDIAVGDTTTNAQRLLGVRRRGSTLERKIDAGHAENGGIDAYNLFVKADLTGEIEIYLENYGTDKAYSMGYFDEDVNYMESWEDISNSSSDTWEIKDLSDYLIKPLYCEINQWVGKQGCNIGNRKNGSSDDRYVDVGGNTTYDYWANPISFCCNFDDNKKIQVYGEDITVGCNSFFAGCFVKYKPPPASNYTELAPTSITPAITGAWTDYDLYTNKSIPKGAVVDMIVSNTDATNEYEGGARNDGSSLVRKLDIARSELSSSNDCNNTVRMLVTCDASTGNFEYYAENTAIRFIIIGYWQGQTFTERFDKIEVTSATDNMWTDINLNTLFSTPVSRVYDIALINANTYTRYLGCRINGSALERKWDYQHADGGGENGYNNFVKADASGIFEVFLELYSSNYAYSMGYWEDTVDYQELWENIYIHSDSTWDIKDLSIFIDEGKQVEILCNMPGHNTATTWGVRKNGSSDVRTIKENHSYNGTTTYYTILPFVCNIDLDYKIEVYTTNQTKADFKLAGYFK